MHSLYDFGYQIMGKRPAEMLVKWIQDQDACLVDIRYSPRSKDPQWNGGNLKRLLGERYIHLSDLGNVNYKNGEGIEFANLSAGLMKLSSIVADKPAVLLCACRGRSYCHRTTVAIRFEFKFGVKCQELTVSMIEGAMKAETKQDNQLTLL